MPRGTTAGGVTPDKPFVASMGIYVFSREVLLEILEQPGVDFGKEIIPKALGEPRGQSVHLPRLLGRRRHHRRVLPRQHPAHAAAARRSISSTRAADLHASALSARRRAPTTAASTPRSSRRAATWISCEISDSVVGIRTHVGTGRAHHAVGAARRGLL